MAETSLLSGPADDALGIYFEFFEKSEQRAERFSSAVDRALSDLGQFPESGSKFEPPFRRKLAPGFYDFGVFYTIEGSRIILKTEMESSHAEARRRGESENQRRLQFW